jgi:salicylate hydroxylase
MSVELEGKPFIGSPNLYGDPTTVLACYGYDVEACVDRECFKFLHGKDAIDVKTRAIRE